MSQNVQRMLLDAGWWWP